jgi:hypothetical protein
MHNVVLALHFLTRCMTYEVAAQQDLGFPLRRMPTRPRSGVVLRKIRATARLAADAPATPSATAARATLAASAVGTRHVAHARA